MSESVLLQRVIDDDNRSEEDEAFLASIMETERHASVQRRRRGQRRAKQRPWQTIPLLNRSEDTSDRGVNGPEDKRLRYPLVESTTVMDQNAFPS